MPSLSNDSSGSDDSYIAGNSDSPLPEEDIEIRREKLKVLLKLGKTRGFLIHSEIKNEFIIDSGDDKVFDSLVDIFNGMGIAVYEFAPSTDSVLLNAPSAGNKSENNPSINSSLSKPQTSEITKSVPFKKVSSSSFGTSGTDFLLNPSILSNIATGLNKRKAEEREEIERELKIQNERLIRERLELAKALEIQEELREQARKRIEELKIQKSLLWKEAEDELQSALTEIYKAAFSGKNFVELKFPKNLTSRVIELLKPKGIRASIVEKAIEGQGNFPELETLYSNIEDLIRGFDKVDQELTSRHLSSMDANFTKSNKDIYQLIEEAEDKEELEERVELDQGITSKEAIISDAFADILSLIESSRQESDGKNTNSSLYLISPESLAELYGHLKTLKMYLFSLERDLSLSDSASGVIHVRDSIRSTSSMIKKIENIEILLKKIEAPDHDNYHVKASWQAKELNEYKVDEEGSIVSWLITNGGKGLCSQLIQKIHESATSGAYSITFEMAHTGFQRDHWGANGCMKVVSGGESLGIFPGTPEYLTKIFKFMGFKSELLYRAETRELMIAWG